MTDFDLLSLSALSWRVRNRQKENIRPVISKLLDSESDFCGCQRCILDMKAIALNNLQPDYVPLNTEIKESQANLDTLQISDFAHLFTQVYKAAIKVREHPNHTDESVILRNSNHDILRAILPEFLAEKTEHYRTKEYLSRIVALTLNEMKPKYTTTSKGEVYARTEEIDRNHFAHVYAILNKVLIKIQNDDQQSGEAKEVYLS